MLVPRSGVEKSQILLGNTPQAQWGELTTPFVQRYIQQLNRTAAPTTTQQDKFIRKDLTKTTQV
jgi:hypothetical protein